MPFRAGGCFCVRGASKAPSVYRIFIVKHLSKGKHYAIIRNMFVQEGQKPRKHGNSRRFILAVRTEA